MMWATRSGIGFFRGWDRLPLPPGKKGCLVAVVAVTTGLAVLFCLAYFFSLLGVVIFAVLCLALSWPALTRLEKANKEHQAALQEEQRHSAAESDTDFHIS
jgi:membrane protein implicated in regulation of membrane protease activity